MGWWLVGSSPTPLEEVYRDTFIVTKRLDGEAVSSSFQPGIMATMLQQLAVLPGHRVLEIGAGTGYNAALLAHLAGERGEVVTLDVDEDLAESARGHLAAAGFARVRVIRADGGLGFAEGAPWDRIILTVGAWDVTPAWREQLAPGGRLVLPLALGGGQRTIALTPADGHLASVSLRDCMFMPLRGAFAAPPDRVRLGADPTVELFVHEPDSVDAGAVRALLDEPSADADTGIEVTLREVYGGAIQWLAVRERAFAWLLATGEGCDAAPVPLLYATPGQSLSTAGLVDGGAACFLTRPPGTPPPARFTLGVRGFGESGALAARVTGAIKAWDACGRPATTDLRVHAYPVESAPPASAGTIVIARRWHHYHLDWPAQSQTSR